MFLEKLYNIQSELPVVLGMNTFKIEIEPERFTGHGVELRLAVCIGTRI